MEELNLDQIKEVIKNTNHPLPSIDNLGEGLYLIKAGKQSIIGNKAFVNSVNEEFKKLLKDGK